MQGGQRSINLCLNTQAQVPPPHASSCGNGVQRQAQTHR